MTGTHDPNLSLPDDGRRNCNPPGVGFRALFWHRFGNRRRGVYPRPLRIPLSMLYKIISKQCAWFCGTMLPYTVQVEHQARFDYSGANAVVTRFVPAGAVTSGVPARLLRMRSESGNTDD